MKYARVLLEHCSSDATKLFIDYYTGKYRIKKDVPVMAPQAPEGGMSSAMSNITYLLPLPYMNTSNLASTASPGNQVSTPNEARVLQGVAAEEEPLVYDVPKPRTAFSSFVDHPDEFITFLEACLKEEDMKQEETIDLYTTLFD